MSRSVPARRTLAGKNVGSQAITSTGTLALGNNAAGDYTLTGASGSVTISAEPITIAATNQSKTYGSVSLGTSAYSVSSGAVQGSDTISSVDPDAGGHQLAGHQRLRQSERGQLLRSWASGATGTGGFNTTNYAISYATTDGSRSASWGLTVSGISGSNQTYNAGTNDPLTGTASAVGQITNDNVSLTGNRGWHACERQCGQRRRHGHGLRHLRRRRRQLQLLAACRGQRHDQPGGAGPSPATNQNQTYGFGGTGAALGTNGFTASVGTIYGKRHHRGDACHQRHDLDLRSTIKAGTFNLTRRRPPAAALPTTPSPTPPTPTVWPWRRRRWTVSGITGSNQTYNGTTVDGLSGTASLSGNITNDVVSLTGTGVGTLASKNAGTEGVTVTATAPPAPTPAITASRSLSWPTSRSARRR